ncbi:endospore coat-associated protein YheC [Polycladomyces abyssicola]|uniref:Endospore coat-associated protein YheC n=1 Tax=Polycladomyces abyssicola TaxID=1125966 RepID=A0A8D5UEZ8_9BACL|nr:YheC/YheD family protein [Polycladomyces abyssicola]BCU81023.1 endospore coat-associated protein YheC [Polycladomyces abyssicola]
MSGDHDKTPTLGITVCKTRGTPPFHETAYFKQLTREGQQVGIRVIVFCPKDVNWARRSVSAWHYSTRRGQWIAAIYPLPHLIYDRCYYTNARHYLDYKPYVNRLATDPQIRLLGRPLGGKWQTYLFLAKDPDLRPHLPETRRLTTMQDLYTILGRYRSAVIKPNGGSHGQGVAAILPGKDGIRVHGRTRGNRTFDDRLVNRSQMEQWISQFTQGTRYVVQPYLPLCTTDGRPFDVRILIQKSERGDWVRTGMAVRVGKPQTLTSNLHGGGKAVKAEWFFSRQYEPELRTHILERLEWLSTQVPMQIEARHGRMVEVGLDVGVDPQGRVWLLEVNSKPGRSVFLLTGEKEIRRRSIELPMRYARALLDGQVGGSR